MSASPAVNERPSALVTGANTGIGLATARQLAASGFRVLITGRHAESIERAAADVRRATRNPDVDPLVLDLGNAESIRACATAVVARASSLHVLINNAGTVPHRGERTASGFEQAFGVNHVGHFLLTALLVDFLRASAPSRVVTVASHAHYGVRGFDWSAVRLPTRSRLGYREYAASKLANVLFSVELGRRLGGTGVTTYAVHPGVVASDLWRGVYWPVRKLITWPMISSDRGADTSVYCATAPALARETGLYYDKRAPKSPSRAAADPSLARELWARTEAWIQSSSNSEF
ncbi:MAG: SDR family oxidoreductase [Acidobacteria bacterium]|nr:SDR family oxidoreductase [Acidobacteriota bacterium]